MKKYELIEIENVEISEKLDFENIWYEYVLILKENQNYDFIYFVKGDLLKLEREEMLEHYFEDKIPTRMKNWKMSNG